MAPLKTGPVFRVLEMIIQPGMRKTVRGFYAFLPMAAECC